MTIKLVAFDWNGTLVNDCEWIFEGIQEIFKHFGKPIPHIDEYRDEISNDYLPFYRKRGIEASRETLNEIMNGKLRTMRPPQLFPDTRSTLKFFNMKGIALALITLRDIEALKQDLELHRLLSAFDSVRGDATEKHKVLEGLMRTFHVAPEEVVFVSDTASDIAAGKLAGVCTVAITHGFNSRKKLVSVKPDIIIDELSALPKIFGRLL